jgi:hypothetical protein
MLSAVITYTEAWNRANLLICQISTVVAIGVAAFDLIEVLLGRAAQGAHPISGQILKIGAFVDTVIGIAYLGTVLITAQLASIYAHSSPSFQMVIVILRGKIMTPQNICSI